MNSAAKIILIYRSIRLDGENTSYKNSYEFQEKPTYYLVIRPDYSSNKILPKDSIMGFNKPSIEMMGKEISCGIWCFDYQEKEAEEMIENYITELINKREARLKEELDNLDLMRKHIKEVKITMDKF